MRRATTILTKGTYTGSLPLDLLQIYKRMLHRSFYIDPVKEILRVILYRNLQDLLCYLFVLILDLCNTVWGLLPGYFFRPAQLSHGMLGSTASLTPKQKALVSWYLIGVLVVFWCAWVVCHCCLGATSVVPRWCTVVFRWCLLDGSVMVVFWRCLAGILLASCCRFAIGWRSYAFIVN